MSGTRASARERSKRQRPGWPLPPLTVTDDGCWMSDLKPGKKGYVRIGLLGRQYTLHRLAYEQFRGPIPRGAQLDHKCRNRACCNPWHLRPATNTENAQNRAACGDRNTSSRFRGVSFHAHTGRWQAQANVNGQQHYLGLHGSEEAASVVASAFRAQHMPFSEVDRG